jgi:hypothetical protein
MCRAGNPVEKQRDERDTSSLRWLAGMFLASIFTFSYVLTPPYILAAILALAFRYPNGNAAFFFALPLILSVFSKPWPNARIIGYMTPMLDYFQFEQIIETDKVNAKEELLKGKNYIFACQPHGVFSLCGICSSINATEEFRKIQTAVASSLLSFPILKNVMGIFRLVDASGKSLKKIIQKPGIDGSVVIYIGGIAELFKCSRDEERLYLSQRKGFIKLALREGVDIIPVYLFGNTSVLSLLRHGPLAEISRKLGVSFTMIWGKYFLPIPRDDKLLYVAGSPIEIPRIAEPTQEDIDKYHTIYCDEVARIFDTYKHKLPLYKNKTLFID